MCFPKQISIMDSNWLKTNHFYWSDSTMACLILSDSICFHVFPMLSTICTVVFLSCFQQGVTKHTAAHMITQYYSCGCQSKYMYTNCETQSYPILPNHIPWRHSESHRIPHGYAKNIHMAWEPIVCICIYMYFDVFCIILCLILFNK